MAVVALHVGNVGQNGNWPLAGEAELAHLFYAEVHDEVAVGQAGQFIAVVLVLIVRHIVHLGLLDVQAAVHFIVKNEQQLGPIRLNDPSAEGVRKIVVLGVGLLDPVNQVVVELIAQLGLLLGKIRQTANVVGMHEAKHRLIQ